MAILRSKTISISSCSPCVSCLSAHLIFRSYCSFLYVMKAVLSPRLPAGLRPCLEIIRGIYVVPTNLTKK